MKYENIEDLKLLLLDIEDLFANLDITKKELENEIAMKEAEQEDYLHELEFAKLNGIEIMSVSKSLIQARKDRRVLKNRLELIKTLKGYTDKYINKGIIPETRQVIQNIDTLKSNQEKREYTPRVVKNLKCIRRKDE